MRVGVLNWSFMNSLQYFATFLSFRLYFYYFLLNSFLKRFIAILLSNKKKENIKKIVKMLLAERECFNKGKQSKQDKEK